MKKECSLCPLCQSELDCCSFFRKKPLFRCSNPECKSYDLFIGTEAMWAQVSCLRKIRAADKRYCEPRKKEISEKKKIWYRKRKESK